MKSNLLGAGLLSVMVLASACNKPKDNNETEIRYKQQSSEELALAGEQLMTPSSFVLADKVLSEALAKDAGNKRAQLYKALLKPFLVFRGYGVRLRPLVKAHGDMVAFEKGLDEIPASTTRDFVMDGQEDIRTIADAQNLLVQYRNANIELYNWLKANEDLELVINLNPWIFSNAVRNYLDDCRLIESSPEGMRVKCDHRNVLQRKFTTVDNIALRQGVAGLALYGIIYTSYSMDGVEKIINVSKQRELTTDESMKLFNSVPEAGVLRADNTMKYIHTFGSDYAYAMNFVIKNQQKVCPAGTPTVDKQRKGQVFENGFCIENDIQKDLATLNQALKGAFTTEFIGQDGFKHSVTVDPFALALRPSANIRTYLPSALDKCGHAVSYADKTLGGILPKGDVEQYLDRSCQ